MDEGKKEGDWFPLFRAFLPTQATFFAEPIIIIIIFIEGVQGPSCINLTN